MRSCGNVDIAEVQLSLDDPLDDENSFSKLHDSEQPKMNRRPQQIYI
jgi:hypothetical protein